MNVARKNLLFARKGYVRLLSCFVLCTLPVWAQQDPPSTKTGATDAAPPQSINSLQQPVPEEPGRISGKVVDQTGANITGATITLTRDGQSSPQQAISDEEGKFYFFNVPPGPFHLGISSPGLAPQEFSATLHAGDTLVTPLFMLVVATQVTEVTVALTPEQIATEQIKEQEKQRVFGVIPNFFVSYVPDAAPLKPRHKFSLAWKSSTDPFTFVAVGAIAGAFQAGNRWSGYGQGAEGYAKRFGAAYADVFVGTYMGGAVFPTILKQDPRYYYRGKGSKLSRFLYAAASSVICKGDNGHWQPNYSNVLGNLAAGGISNLYYPASSRHGASLVFSTAFIRLGEVTIANIFQEFLVPKLTPNLPTRAPTQPENHEASAPGSF